MSDPVVNNDRIGIPSVGVQSSHTTAYAEKWQFGIAVPLNNRKFDFGTVITLGLAADPYADSHINVDEKQFGVAHINQNSNSVPSNFLQYGDKAVLGPSSMTNYEGRTETIRLAGASQDQVTNVVSWTNGIVYTIDRKNKYKYELSDPVTVYGTGLAENWFPRNAQLATVGIRKGYSHLGPMGRYSPNMVGTAVDHVDTWEEALGNNFIGLRIMLPANASFDAAAVSGPNTGPATVTRGPSVFNSTRGLMPIRDALTQLTDNDGGWDWIGDLDNNGTNDVEGIFRYVREHNDGSDYARFAYNSNVDAQSPSNPWNSSNAYAPILTGFVHPGGNDEKKETAQALFAMVNSLSDTPAGNYMSNGVFTQLLTRPNDSRDVQYAKLVPGTSYRLGLTWKGNLRPDNATNVNGSQIFAKFQWGPVVYHGAADVNHYVNGMISTDPLLNAASRSQNSYMTNMVSGYVQSIDVDDLDTEDNLKVEVVMQVKSPSGYVTARQYRGAEALMFIDNIWLEHEGDIPGASGNGYVEINHFPEQGSLRTNRFEPVKVATVQKAHGGRQNIDPSGGMREKFLWHIEADFLRVDYTVWQQFQALLKWQDLGYNITCHPFLPEVPHCLVGEISLTNINKSFWDLQKFSFRLKFTETE